MKIFNAEQIRRWDQYTISKEPVSSIDLMERAATACANWIDQHFPGEAITIFCGKGNNGGDGLAIARLLSQRAVTVYILEFGHKGTDDFQTNLSKLHQFPVDIRFIQAEDDLPGLTFSSLIIDALFGSGLNRRLEGTTATLVNGINQSGARIISIDLPSGMFADRSSAGDPIIKADHTLTFQVCKEALLLAENAPYSGEVHILDIGLHPDFYEQEQTDSWLTDKAIISSMGV